MPQAAQAMSGITFGCDPELFIFDMNTGEYISPDNFIPGTKAEPYKVPGGAVQQDGMAAEFNIDPVDNFTDFNKNIKKVLNSLKLFVPPSCTLVAKPTAVFSEKVWGETSETSKELGCSPDFNAWTGKVNPPPDPSKASSPRLRTASGHLHVGWTDEANMSDPSHVKNCLDLVKQMDWFLGPWSVTQDGDTVRRELYGKAGACRFKPYGVEYRVLSNFWVTNLEGRKQVWNRMNAAIWSMANKFFPETTAGQGFDFNGAVIQSINDSKVDSTLSDFFLFPVKTVSSDYVDMPYETYNA